MMGYFSAHPTRLNHRGRAGERGGASRVLGARRGVSVMKPVPAAAVTAGSLQSLARERRGKKINCACDGANSTGASPRLHRELSRKSGDIGKRGLSLPCCPPHPLREGVISSHYYYYYRGTRSMQKKNKSPRTPCHTWRVSFSPLSLCPSRADSSTKFPPFPPCCPSPHGERPCTPKLGHVSPLLHPSLQKAIPSSPPRAALGSGEKPPRPCIKPPPSGLSPYFCRRGAGLLPFSLI